MNTAQPIRSKKELDHFKNYYKTEEINPRNQVLITIGLNTALRISDILSLKWKDVYNEEKGTFNEHISIEEQKTGKISCIYMNKTVKSTLKMYKEFIDKEHKPDGERYLFEGKALEGDVLKPISRVQAFRIVRKAAKNCHLQENISPHSLRKTFGYHAWKQGVAPVLLMDVYNHTSFTVTKRYLGIKQDDRDEVFKSVNI